MKYKTAFLTPYLSSFHCMKRFGYWRIDDYANHKCYRGWRTSQFHKRMAKLRVNND